MKPNYIIESTSVFDVLYYYKEYNVKNFWFGGLTNSFFLLQPDNDCYNFNVVLKNIISINKMNINFYIDVNSLFHKPIYKGKKNIYLVFENKKGKKTNTFENKKNFLMENYNIRKKIFNVKSKKYSCILRLEDICEKYNLFNIINKIIIFDKFVDGYFIHSKENNPKKLKKVIEKIKNKTKKQILICPTSYMKNIEFFRDRKIKIIFANQISRAKMKAVALFFDNIKYASCLDKNLNMFDIKYMIEYWKI